MADKNVWALPPEAMAGFRPDQMRELDPAAMKGWMPAELEFGADGHGG